MTERGSLRGRVDRLRLSSPSGRGSVAVHARLVDLCEQRDADGAARVSFETWQILEPLLVTLHDDLDEPTSPAPQGD